MSVTSSFNQLVSFRQVLDYLVFTSTGSTVYVPAVLPVDGSQGNQLIMSSGSLQSIINSSLNFIVPLISVDTAMSGFVDYGTSLGSSDVINLARSLALDYIGFRAWLGLFGGLLTNGWDYKLSELSVTRATSMGLAIRGTVEGYKLGALQKLNTLQPMSLSVEGNRVEDMIGNTAPPFY